MNKPFLTISSVALLLGFTSAVYAQPTSGAGDLSGLESRSLEFQSSGAPRSNLYVSGNVPPQINPATINIDPVSSQIVIEQFGDRSQLVISPTKEDRELSAPPGAGFSGNNRVQLLYPTD